MVKFDNDFKFNKNYISKAYISKTWLKNNGLGNFTVSEAKYAFNYCEIKYIKTGNPYNERQRKTTKYVNTYELKNMLVIGYNRSNKQK